MKSQAEGLTQGLTQGLVVVVTAIFLLGCVSIFSTTSAEVLDHTLSTGEHVQLFKQLGYAAAGLLLAWAVYRAGFERVFEAVPFLMNLFIALLILTLIPGIGREVNGSKRWLFLFGVSFQPSEFVKILVPAFFLYYYRGGTRAFEAPFKDFLKLTLRSLIPVFLILIEPNNGTAMVITLALVLTFWLANVPFKYWALPLLVVCAIGAVFATSLPYVARRLEVYLYPERDLKGKGHQPYQAKIATGSGGLFGKGPAKSLQKLSYLPEAQNDYIAAIFAEEFGFLGIALLIILYMALAAFGFTIASRAQEGPPMAIAAMATFLITFQAFLNLGVVSGLLPSTGLNLPFFSQGGSSLMANTVELSLLFQIGGTCQKS